MVWIVQQKKRSVVAEEGARRPFIPRIVGCGAVGSLFAANLATLDDEGYCSIVGRSKDMIIRGGENIYPREIEEFLFRHPKIQGVACFGVPDSIYGEVLCAWVQLRAGAEANEDAIKVFCKGQIAHYKVPHYVRFVDEFPMTVTGKLQKFIRRERMMRELDLKIEPTA